MPAPIDFSPLWGSSARDGARFGRSGTLRSLGNDLRNSASHPNDSENESNRDAGIDSGHARIDASRGGIDFTVREPVFGVSGLAVYFSSLSFRTLRTHSSGSMATP
jgi:hypothetical protein